MKRETYTLLGRTELFMKFLDHCVAPGVEPTLPKHCLILKLATNHHGRFVVSEDDIIDSK